MHNNTTTRKANTETIVSGALKRWGGTNITEFIKGTMKLSDLQWVLSHLFENITKRIRVIRILSQRTSNKFIAPYEESQKDFHKFDGVAIDLLSKETSLLELSPLAPLGTTSILTNIRQGNILPTSRMTELVSDIATSLSVECAVRHGGQLKDIVRVASSHRIVRTQDFSSFPSLRQHFRMFGLCTSGNKQAISIQDILFEQISFYILLLSNLRCLGYDISDITLCISDITVTDKLIRKGNILPEKIRAMTMYEQAYDLCSEANVKFTRFSNELPINTNIDFSSLSSMNQIIACLKHSYPMVNIIFDLGRIAGIGYYDGLCFKITARNKEGLVLPLVDGGSTDWVAKLLCNKKMVCVASGIGSELFCRKFQ